jgi:3'(2'), 5'-bisphosphate nucleotidase
LKQSNLMKEEIAKTVKEVGLLLLKWRKSKMFQGSWDGSQFKAKVDRMAHVALTERLKTIAPAIPIISEEDETSIQGERPDYYWLIDPIDGTASFVGGFAGFVTQVALVQNCYPIIAAIYAPLLGAFYFAEQGKGATLNGQALHVSVHRKPRILIDNYPKPKGIAKALYEEMNFTRYIECGGISLKTCKIADGTADVFFKNVTIRDWDIAAPQLVLEEAGGVIKNCRGEEIILNGDNNHHGLVAATSQEVCDQVASWYYKFNRRGPLK